MNEKNSYFFCTCLMCMFGHLMDFKGLQAAIISMYLLVSPATSKMTDV